MKFKGGVHLQLNWLVSTIEPEFRRVGLKESPCPGSHASPKANSHHAVPTTNHLSDPPPQHTQLTRSHTNVRTTPDTLPSITHRLLPSLCSRGLMGNLLKVLACAELEHGPIVFLDFERETIRFFCLFVLSYLFDTFCLFFFLSF